MFPNEHCKLLAKLNSHSASQCLPKDRMTIQCSTIFVINLFCLPKKGEPSLIGGKSYTLQVIKNC